MPALNLNERVRSYWEREACGTGDTAGFPRWLWRLFSDDWGWFVTFKAVR